MYPEELEQIAITEREAQADFPQAVNVCVAAGCLSCQSQAVLDALNKEALAREKRDTVRSRASAAWGCVPRDR